MNVAFDPWIPVVTLEGHPKLVSLCEVFTGGDLLSDLSVRPHERVSLMRLFLCIAHASLDGPKDYDEWKEVPARLPEAAKKYLDKWRDSFGLFHPTKPWLQVPNIESGKSAEEGWGPVSKLGFFMASGANTTLFDHEGMDNDNRKIPHAATVLSLLAFQCFSPGGLIAQVMWGGVQTSKSSKDGPCVTASMVHALIRKTNLIQTIQANLPTYEDVRAAYGEHPIGQPVWEKMPKVLNEREDSAKRNATQTYLGRLVPLTRVARLHLDGSKMLMGEGLPFPTFTDGFPPEPSAVIRVRIKDNKPERALLSYRPGHAFWRELPAIIIKRTAEGVGGPLCLSSLGEQDGCDLIVAALARDQATILDTAESVFHISPRLRSDAGCGQYQAEVQQSEELARRLGWAIEDYRKTLDGGWEGRVKGAGPSKGDLLARLHGAGATQYWTTVEQNLGLLMAHIEALGSDQAEPTREAWRTMLWKSACDAYQSVCGQETPRQIKAFTEGWKKLNSKPKEPVTKPKKKGAKG